MHGALAQPKAIELALDQRWLHLAHDLPRAADHLGDPAAWHANNVGFISCKRRKWVDGCWCRRRCGACTTAGRSRARRGPWCNCQAHVIIVVVLCDIQLEVVEIRDLLLCLSVEVGEHLFHQAELAFVFFTTAITFINWLSH